MNKVKLALLCAALVLAACSRKEAPKAVPSAAPVAPPPAVAQEEKPVDLKVVRMMELLRVVYGDQGARQESMEVEMPDPGQGNAIGDYYLEPVAMQEQSDGRVVVVANAELLDDEGHKLTSHSSPGLLSVFILRKEGGKWQVEARHENIAALGSNGRIGEVQWVSLGEGKPGFVVLHGGMWMGSAIGELSAFDLSDGSMRDLTGDCVDERWHCWSIKAKWKFEKREGSEYDDLVLRFSGHEEDRAETEPETARRKRTKVKGLARYKYDGGNYLLVEGENIVPGV